MAVYDLQHSHASTGGVSRLFSTLTGFVGAAIAWNEARQTRNALNTLSDRELEDIGLCRGDIEDVAAHR